MLSLVTLLIYKVLKREPTIINYNQRLVTLLIYKVLKLLLTILFFLIA